MMLLLVLDFEVVLAFVLAIKLHQYLSLQRSCIKSLCNISKSRVFTMKPPQHLSLYRSHFNTCLWNEVGSIFFFASKSYHHLSLSWSCANTCICIEASPLLCLLKQYLHLHLLWISTIICLCNEAALALFFCHKVASTLYLHWSHANIYLCHEAT